MRSPESQDNPSMADTPAPGPEAAQSSTESSLNVYRCNLQGVTLVEASAGTGKTWTLCGLFVRLLLERELGVSQILVVTFTHAATAELRERVRKRLSQCLQWLDRPHDTNGIDDFVPKYLSGLLKANHTENTLRERLQAALLGFDEAAIFTIHGFCHRALNDAAFSSAMPFDPELVHDDSALRLEVAHDFWRRRVVQGPSADVLRWFAIKGDTPDRLAGLLKQRLQRPLSTIRWPQPPPTEIDAASLHRQLLAHFAQARTLWQTERASILQRVISALPDLNRGSYKPESVQAAARQWDEAFALETPLLTTRSGFEKLSLLSSARLKPKKDRPPIAPHAFFGLADQVLQARDTLVPSLDEARQSLLREWLDTGPSQLRALKRSRRLISFDDMLSNLHERLTGGQFPALALSLSQRYPAALIDEFQDTDPLQFSIFQSIYRRPGTGLFFIGDPKQAIYSFRGADLHTYLHARSTAGVQATLLDNQRSTPELIQAVNHLFGAHPRAFMLEGLHYRAVVAGQARRKPFSDNRPDALRGALQCWSLPLQANGDPFDKDTCLQASAAACAGEIARLLNGALAGHIHHDSRPLQASDIAVLVRTHHQGTLVRQALSQRGIDSVELSQASIFASPDALELERILTAIIEPRHEGRVRAALATDLLGWDASALLALEGPGSTLADELARFATWQSLWRQRGPGTLLRQLATEMQLSQRLLQRPDGERRLTNWLHLIEQLHEARREHPSPEAQLRWLGERRRLNDQGDAAQLRLESDAHLVQILTIHRAKGLEFPVVFCPFLWEVGTGSPPRESDGLSYHDVDGQAVWDLQAGLLDRKAQEPFKELVRREWRAEMTRLVYVALTRAVHRCYLVQGPFVTGNSKRAAYSSVLYGLVAGTQPAPHGTSGKSNAPTDTLPAWQRWADGGPSSICVCPLPDPGHARVARASASAADIQARPAPRFIPSGWRLGSYSSLSLGLRNEAASIDHDAHAEGPPDSVTADADADADTPPANPRVAPLSTSAQSGNAIATEPTTQPPPDDDDILAFPRGPVAGDCLHAVLEAVDFGMPGTWPAAVATALRRFPPDVPDHASAAHWPSMILRMLREMTETEFIPGLPLRSLQRPRMRAELEFTLPVKALSASRLQAVLQAHGYDTRTLTFDTLQGYLRGFIDLVFEHAGRYHLIDWKSNFLGDTSAHYREPHLRQAMSRQGYHLQSLLYALAVHRHLRLRLAGYDYAAHFGAAHYLFVRGVRPDWVDESKQPCGVYTDRPTPALIDELDSLMDRESVT